MLIHEKTIATKESLLAQSQAASYLIVAHPTFIGANSAGRDALNEFVQQKQAQAHSVSVVDYLQIVDVFGGGQAGPQGLTKYLQALANIGTLKHVLLVGGGSYDHKDILNTGAITYIPPHYESTASYSMFTNTDAPYVRAQSNELFAAIGRWPARTIDELGHLVDKQLNWGWGIGSSETGTALLAAGQTGTGLEQINFGAALDQLSTNIAPNWNLQKIYIDQILSDNPGMSLAQAAAEARQQFSDGLDAEPNLVMFSGHASSGHLSKQNLFTAAQASNFNTGASMWLPLSCYVTYYESAHTDTLAHQLLFSGNAVSVSGATSYSSQALNETMARGILQGLYRDRNALGQSTNAAFKASANNQLMQTNWATLGDPSLQTIFD